MAETAAPSSAAVEARSLTSLNHLASNPPQYPRNPAHAKQDPLVLYISRVPGTRDIILSTFKPGLENVTGEDVASSLYYLHFELPGPSTTAPAVQQQQLELLQQQQMGTNPSPPRPSFEPAQSPPKAIRRKPVPVPSPSLTADSASPAPSPEPNQMDVHPLFRTPVQGHPSAFPLPSLPRYTPSHQPLPSPSPSPLSQNGFVPFKPPPAASYGHTFLPEPQHKPSPFDKPSEGPLLWIPSPPSYRTQPPASAPHDNASLPGPQPMPRPIVTNFTYPSDSSFLPFQQGSGPATGVGAPASRKALLPSPPARQPSLTDVGRDGDDSGLPPPPVPPRHPQRNGDNPSEPYRSRIRQSLSPPERPSTNRTSLEIPVQYRRLSAAPSVSSSNGLLAPTPGAPSRSTSPSLPREYLPPSPPPASPGYTLTLIRREPSTSQQWNVGRISGYSDPPLSLQHQGEDEGRDGENSIHNRPQGNRPPVLYVHVDTQGYNKFTNPISYRQYAGLDPRFAISTSSLAGPAPSRISQSSVTHEPGLLSPEPATRLPSRSRRSGFQCEVMAIYGKTWTSNLKGIFRRPPHGGRSHSSIGSHSRKQSSDSMDSHSEKEKGGSGRSTVKVRGYEFDSPWEGKCEFRIGDGGRVLRCQHHIPYDAPSLPPTAENDGRSTSEPASELRFHIPRQNHVRSKSSSDMRSQQAAHGHFSRLFRSSSAGSEDDWEGGEDGAGLGIVSPFELNLGREKAGGGHRGMKAKMGKLIVYDGGLKMLDLVVATNMGLWWRLWDQS